MGSRAMNAKGPANPHLVKLGQSGIAGEVADLRQDMDDVFVAQEARTGYPVIKSVVGGSAISISGSPVSAAIAGTGFLQGQTFATRTTGTANAALTISAVRPGTPGNALKTKIVQGGGALAVSYVAPLLTITLATGGSTATAVAAAVNADATAKLVLHAAAGGTGADNVVIASEDFLAGGTGTGLVVTIGGNEQSIEDLVTDTAIAMAADTFTDLANGMCAQLVVKSYDVCSDPVTVGIVT